MRYWYFLLVCISLILPACHEQAGNVLHPEKRRWLIGRKACKKKCLCWGIVIGLLLQIWHIPCRLIRVSSLLYAPETFGNVAAFVMDRIRRSEHVFAHIYQDREQLP